MLYETLMRVRKKTLPTNATINEESHDREARHNENKISARDAVCWTGPFPQRSAPSIICECKRAGTLRGSPGSCLFSLLSGSNALLCVLGYRPQSLALVYLRTGTSSAIALVHSTSSLSPELSPPHHSNEPEYIPPPMHRAHMGTAQRTPPTRSDRGRTALLRAKQEIRKVHGHGYGIMSCQDNFGWRCWYVSASSSPFIVLYTIDKPLSRLRHRSILLPHVRLICI